MDIYMETIACFTIKLGETIANVYAYHIFFHKKYFHIFPASRLLYNVNLHIYGYLSIYAGDAFLKWGHIIKLYTVLNKKLVWVRVRQVAA